MPTTEHFGIYYPEQGDPVDPDHFLQWASDMDAALNLLSTAESQATLRPHGVWASNSGPSLPGGGVYTPIAWNSGYSVGGFGWTGSGSPNITVPSSGVYRAVVYADSVRNASSVDAEEVVVTRSGSVILGKKWSYRTEQPFSQDKNFSGVFLATTSGQTLNVRWRWYGTATSPQQGNVRFAVYKLCDL